MQRRQFRDTAHFESEARAEGFSAPYSWSNAPGDRYAAHEHAYTKLLMCTTGSITFLLGGEGSPFELHAGDGFTLPPRTRHAASVGEDGCTCLEAHRG